MIPSTDNQGHDSRGPRHGRATGSAGPGRANTVRNATAAVLVVAGLALPWNLRFGVGIPGSSRTMFAVLLVVSVLSLTSTTTRWFNGSLAGGRLPLLLNAPYLLLVLAFVGYDIEQTVRTAGTVTVPGGVGPGAWAGVAGALLSAQPQLSGQTDRDDAAFSRWLTAARFIGWGSLIAATASVITHVFWRLRYAFSSGDGSTPELAVAGTTLVYGVVALAAVAVAARWMVRSTPASRLAIGALGLSSLVAGATVWLLPIGREIDAFHGIAQTTAIAGVGWEGFLAWTAVAAIVSPLNLSRARRPTPSDRGAWRSSARDALLLIAAWCCGSLAMRLTDLVVGSILDYPHSAYDLTILAIFDLVGAALAIWLRANLATAARPASTLCGALAALAVCRVVLGVVLAPRFDASTVPANPVYGNALAQQITSTFDVALCGVALGVLAASVITGRHKPAGSPLDGRRRRAARPTGNLPRIAVDSPDQRPTPRIFRGAGRR